MSFFPSAFDPRGAVAGLLDLCAIDTADGTFRFWIGQDGIFTDSDGNQWVGSALSSVTGLQSAIDGVAPEGSISLSFFQDPTMPDLISEVKTLGLDYVKGREVRFYVQPVATVAEMYAPLTPPLLWLTRISRQISYRANGAQDRGLTLSFEAWSERRGGARRIALNTEGHAILTGSANPSLEFKPTSRFEPEKLFG
jgi:hypothetical protein